MHNSAVRSDEIFNIGDKFSDEMERFEHVRPCVIEIMQSWLDRDTGEQYYIVKCVQAAPPMHGMMFEGEVDLIDHYSIEKYYGKRHYG